MNNTRKPPPNLPPTEPRQLTLAKLEYGYLYIFLKIPPTNGAIRSVNQSSCSPEEGSKEDSVDFPGLEVASRDELKVGKLEIDSLYIYEKIPRNIGAIIKV